MTKDKALEMALEFIERVNLNGWMLADLEPEMYSCITAIKDALKTKDKQRTWVGLTDEDKQKLAAEHHDWESLYFAVQAKLKEKNT